MHVSLLLDALELPCYQLVPIIACSEVVRVSPSSLLIIMNGVLTFFPLHTYWVSRTTDINLT